MQDLEKEPESLDWSTIEEEFDKKTDVRQIQYFLKKMTHDLNICTTTECPIFGDLRDLRLSISIFHTYNAYSLEQAEIQIKNQVNLKKFEKDYAEFRRQAETVLNRIFKMKCSHDSLKAIQDEKDKKFKEYLTICAKYGLTPEMDIQKGIQGIANAYAGGSLPLDQIEKDDKKILDAHVKKIREEEKKNKKKTETDKKEQEDNE